MYIMMTIFNVVTQSGSFPWHKNLENNLISILLEFPLIYILL